MASLDGMSATLGAVALGAVDADGVEWRLQTLEGWDSPDSRSEFTEREGDHGSWASPVYLSSRPITLGGTIIAPSQQLLEGAMNQLRAAAGLADTLLTVWETTPKQAIVRRSGRPIMQYLTDTVATYSLLVTAADPRRYAAALDSRTTGLPTVTGGLTLPAALPWLMSATSVSGQIDAVNAGDFETKPLLAITGPVTTPRIQCQMPDGSVRILNYGDALLAGDVLLIDADAHTVTLNGNVSRRRFLALPSGWPVIPAASQVSFYYQAGTYNSTTTLTASWRSAWM